MVSLATRGDIGARDVLGKSDFRQLTLLGHDFWKGQIDARIRLVSKGRHLHTAPLRSGLPGQLFVLRVASSTTFEVHSSASEADMKLLASAAALFLFVSGGALLLKVCRGSERQD